LVRHPVEILVVTNGLMVLMIVTWTNLVFGSSVEQCTTTTSTRLHEFDSNARLWI